MWWTNEEDETSVRVIALHIDLVGHSKWAEGDPVELGPAAARREFAADLSSKLQLSGFDCLFWAGDGGLFVRKFNGSPKEFEHLFSAAKSCFDIFNQWNKTQGNKLRIRVLGAYLPRVISYRKAGDWFSPRLNALIKYERELASENAFVVTEELRNQLDPRDNFYKHLVSARRVNLPNGESMTVRVDDRYPITVKESAKRFKEWARSQQKELRIPCGAAVPDPPNLTTLGENILLDGPLEERGYRYVELTPVLGESRIPESIHTVWMAKRQKLQAKNLPGTKLSVVQFRGELTDEPVARLKYRLTPFEEVRAFQAVMESSDSRRLETIAQALNVTRDGTWLPSSLCCHILVLLKNAAGGREILLAHRRKGGRAGGYFHNCWSVSMEEGFSTDEKNRNNELIPPDHSIRDTVVRGVKEELVGNRFSGQINVSLHGLFLEWRLMNFSFLVIAELPDTTFDEVATWWPDALDHAEHDVLAALPFDSKVLRTCIECEQLPRETRNQARFRGELLEDGDHRWHPTASIRLALGLWHLSVRQDSASKGAGT